MKKLLTIGLAVVISSFSANAVFAENADLAEDVVILANESQFKIVYYGEKKLTEPVNGQYAYGRVTLQGTGAGSGTARVWQNCGSGYEYTDIFLDTTPQKPEDSKNVYMSYGCQYALDINNFGDSQLKGYIRNFD